MQGVGCNERRKIKMFVGPQCRNSESYCNTIFNSLLKSSIDRHAPLRKMKITRPPAPWLNAEDIKQLQSERNKLRHLAHATKKDSIWQLFRGIRNKIKTRIKEAKRSFYRKALSSRKPKDLWRTIHPYIPVNKKFLRIPMY